MSVKAAGVAAAALRRRIILGELREGDALPQEDALLDGTATLEQLEEDLFGLILEVASGRKLASNERQGYREIAIWKEGVTL